MGSFSILVIGDWRQELEPHLELEYIGNPFSPHIRCVDILNDGLKNEYRQKQKKEKARQQISFSQWLHQGRGLNTLAQDETPNLAGAHRYGWVRIDQKGEVTEVIRRNPDATFHHISGELQQFLLKPGAIGWVVDAYQSEDIKITQGYASSARLCDIDFATMREPQVAQAPANWDWARRLAAGRTWVSLKEICERRGVSIEDKSAAKAAVLEWRKQPIIQELCGYEYLRSDLSPSALDALLLPRNDYVEHCIHRAKVLDYQEVLMQGRFLGMVEESELLSRLSGDSHLTSVVIKH